MRWKKYGNYASTPLLKIFSTPLLALVVGKENVVIGLGAPHFLVIGLGAPHFRNASAISACDESTQYCAMLCVKNILPNVFVMRAHTHFLRVHHLLVDTQLRIYEHLSYLI